jgi:hypothetical protein
MAMVLKWSALKTMAGSRYARLAVLVPIIGWLLVVDNEFAAVISKLTGVTEIASPSWKIYSLHVGLSIFGFGVGIFYLLCPPVIKQHNNFNEFCTSEARTITDERLRLYAVEANVPDLQPNASSLVIQDDPRTARDLWYNRNLGRILEIFSQYYEYNDVSKHWLMKWFALLLFIVGGIFTFVPSLMTVLWSVGKIFIS